MNKIIALAIRVSGFGWVFDKINGYKTKIGAVSLMLSGLAELTQRIVNLTDMASWLAFVRALPTSDGWLAVAAGFAAWGLAHKIEKAEANANTPPAPPIP